MLCWLVIVKALHAIGIAIESSGSSDGMPSLRYYHDWDNGGNSGRSSTWLAQSEALPMQTLNISEDMKINELFAK